MTANSPLVRERETAVRAVQLACSVTRSVFHQLVAGQTLTKADKSPVTVADFASQAVINSVISQVFPQDDIIGEEDADDLRRETDEAKKLRRDVVRLAREALKRLPSAGPEEEATEESILAAIDRGRAVTTTAKGRCWALDPIDGTKGFLRGGQYAVCLALLHDGRPVLGVTGCPNLPLDYRRESKEEAIGKGATGGGGGGGVLFIAEAGHGAFQRPLEGDASASRASVETAIAMNEIQPDRLSDASFCESVESGHSAQDDNAKIARRLGITREPVRMDSQAKYCSVSRGDGDIYLRLPVSQTYEEKIWDHASGVVLVQEAGGQVSDMHGNPLDFSVGRTLKRNKGVIAAHRKIHATVIEAVRAVVASPDSQTV